MSATNVGNILLQIPYVIFQSIIFHHLCLTSFSCHLVHNLSAFCKIQCFYKVQGSILGFKCVYLHVCKQLKVFVLCMCFVRRSFGTGLGINHSLLGRCSLGNSMKEFAMNIAMCKSDMKKMFKIMLVSQQSTETEAKPGLKRLA